MPIIEHLLTNPLLDESYRVVGFAELADEEVSFFG
jgi:hypothetical protein